MDCALGIGGFRGSLKVDPRPWFLKFGTFGLESDTVLDALCSSSLLSSAPSLSFSLPSFLPFLSFSRQYMCLPPRCNTRHNNVHPTVRIAIQSSGHSYPVLSCQSGSLLHDLHCSECRSILCRSVLHTASVLPPVAAYSSHRNDSYQQSRSAYYAIKYNEPMRTLYCSTLLYCTTVQYSTCWMLHAHQQPTPMTSV